MADKIRVNYPAVQDMSKQMDHVSDELQRFNGSLNKIIAELQGGVLQGQPGDALVAALQVLSKKTMDLAFLAYMVRIGIDNAIGDMQAADGTAAGDFK